MDIDDKEIAAMRELYRLLKPFDRAAQERITSYVGQRLITEASREQQEEWMAQQKDYAAQQLSNSSGAYPAPPPLNQAIGRLG